MRQSHSCLTACLVPRWPLAAGTDAPFGACCFAAKLRSASTGAATPSLPQRQLIRSEATISQLAGALVPAPTLPAVT